MALFELLAGTLLGLLTGLVPFVHTNLVLQVTKNPFGYGAGELVFLAALSFSHLAAEAVPAIYFLSPSGDFAAFEAELGQMARVGKASEALVKTLAAMLLAIVVSLALAPLFFTLLPFLLHAARDWAKYLFVAVIAAYFVSDARNIGKGLLIFFVAGLLGHFVFSGSLLMEPLFPLLTGLFGLPVLFTATAEYFPREDAPPISRALRAALTRKDFIVVVASCIAGALSTLFPALTPGILIGVMFLFLSTSQVFVTASAAVLASKTFYDFVGALSTGKARSMAAALAQENAIQGETALWLVAAASLFSLSVAAAIVFLFRSKIPSLFPRRNFLSFKAGLLAFFCLLVFVFEGQEGLFVAATASCVGLLPMLLRAKRSYLSGALILPSMLYFFGIA